MSLIHCSFFSKSLMKMTNYAVILPRVDLDAVEKGFKFQTCLLLHGLGDDYTNWLRFSSIERYADENMLAVLLPFADKSFYTDMKHGHKFAEFVGKEVHEFSRAHFPLSDKREDNFIAGLSMGGYGAFKLALARPEKYAAAASFSGSVMIKHIYSNIHVDMLSIFGPPEEMKEEEDIPYLLHRDIAENRQIPKLIQYCGTSDFLYKHNVELRGIIEKTGVDYVYEEWEGTHEWGFWDLSMQKALKEFGLKKSVVY